ncbi:MAG: hypothetical protein C4543_05635 [Ignavibacteriales bacterium]|nr:MAG: hypothetical protein C4543_05635 [Ignavibacteriales bacterium]
MRIIKELFSLFSIIFSNHSSKHYKPAPLLIIKKESSPNNSDVKEYNSIDEAIADLENDPNVPKEKIEKLKSSLRKLKDKTSIKIKNGELIK